MVEWCYLEPFQFNLLRNWLLGADLPEGDPTITKRFQVYTQHLGIKTKAMKDPVNPSLENVVQLTEIWRDMFRDVYKVEPMPWEARKIETDASIGIS